MLASTSPRVRCCSSRGTLSAVGSALGRSQPQRHQPTAICHLQSSSVQIGSSDGVSSVISSNGSKCFYVTRAHPRTVPEHPVKSAIQMVLDGVEERKVKRAEKWERNAEYRRLKGKEVSLFLVVPLIFLLFFLWSVDKNL